MKHQKISRVLITIGVILLVIAVMLLVFAMFSAEKVGIIGGADTPTFAFVFFHQYHGLCFWVTLMGVLSCLGGTVLCLAHRHQ